MAARLVVVGGGRMGEALVAGLLAGGWAQPAEVVVAEKDAARREGLAQRFDGVDVQAAPKAAEGAVIAVKPNDVEAACRAVAEAGASRVLSIAAGVRLARLEDWLGRDVPVVRAMPNTPALVGAGAAAVAPGRVAGEADLQWAEGILSSVGIAVRVPEDQLDAVTAVSGSGPAYVFLLAEALMDAGVAGGLSPQVTSALVSQTVLGAARLLVESGEAPERLRANVTSPGGTTAAAVEVLESRAVRDAFFDAVQAATERSRQLGSPGGA